MKKNLFPFITETPPARTIWRTLGHTRLYDISPLQLSQLQIKVILFVFLKSSDDFIASKNKVNESFTNSSKQQEIFNEILYKVSTYLGVKSSDMRNIFDINNPHLPKWIGDTDLDLIYYLLKTIGKINRQAYLHLFDREEYEDYELESIISDDSVHILHEITRFKLCTYGKSIVTEMYSKIFEIDMSKEYVAISNSEELVKYLYDILFRNIASGQLYSYKEKLMINPFILLR